MRSFMKKYFTIFLLVIFGFTVFNPSQMFADTCEIDFYSSVSEKKADSGVGFRLKNKMDISAIFSQEFKNFEYTPYSTQRYGALLRVTKEHFFCDMTFYAGTLRYSGSYARLKNPCLPTVSPLATITFLQAGIKPALPTFTSTRQKESIAIKTPVFSGAYFENGTYTWSIHKTLPHFSAAISGAQHIYGRKKSKSWFTKDRYFAPKKYSSYDAEICFSAGSILTSCNAVGIIENPFGGLEKSYLWLRSQNSLRLNHLFIQTAYFKAWTPLMILPTGSKAGTQRQFILNPKLILYPFDGTLKAGFAIQKNEKQATSFPYKYYEDYVMKSEIAYSYNRTKFDINYSVSYSGKTEKTSYKAKAYLSHKFDKASLSTYAIANFYTNKTTLTLSQGLSTTGNPSVSLKMNDYITYKDGLYDSSKLTCTAGITFKTDYTKWKGKLVLSTSF